MRLKSAPVRREFYVVKKRIKKEGINMEDKKITMVWSISLFNIGITTVIISANQAIDIGLTDTWIRAFGIVELIAIFFFSFFSVKKFSKRKK